MRISKVAVFSLFSASLCFSAQAAQVQPVKEELLGWLLFQDKNLSLNRNQSCASCHSLFPDNSRVFPSGKVAGFADPDNVRKGSAVSQGSVKNKHGALNAPSVGYAVYSPEFHWDENEGLYVGGQFWNGRAKNLAEQARQPFLNPAEMAMANEWSVVGRIKENPLYRFLFRHTYRLNLDAVPKPPQEISGKDATPPTVKRVYELMAKAIGAFEKTAFVNKFNSKFDYVMAGRTNFTPIEKKGFDLFVNEKKGNCAACHITTPTFDNQGNYVPALFTDFTYDNIGLPRNVNIPGNPKPNFGLGGREDIKKLDPAGNELGKHKVMTLRNIAITPPYGHNGVFATLEQITHFYNTRDTLGQVPDNRHKGFAVTGWPTPEIGQNVNHDELGNLGLTPDEEKAIVAFMKTLTDDYPVWGKDPRVPPYSPPPY